MICAASRGFCAKSGRAFHADNALGLGALWSGTDLGVPRLKGRGPCRRHSATGGGRRASYHLHVRARNGFIGPRL